MRLRFTERARKTIYYAQEEAGKLGHKYVSTEHLLLGVIRENDSVAGRILERFGISANQIRVEVMRHVRQGNGHQDQDMHLTPRAKRVIDLAYDEARQLNNNYIGTKHLLLGLIREGDGLGARVLAKVGIRIDETRAIAEHIQASAPQHPTHEKETEESITTNPNSSSLDNPLTINSFLPRAIALSESFGTEPSVLHLLLAILEEPKSHTTRVLQRLGVTRETLEEVLKEIDGETHSPECTD